MVAFGTNLSSLPNNLNSIAAVFIGTAVTNRSLPPHMCVTVQRLCIKACFQEGSSGLLVMVSDSIQYSDSIQTLMVSVPRIASLDKQGISSCLPG